MNLGSVGFGIAGAFQGSRDYQEFLLRQALERQKLQSNNQQLQQNQFSLDAARSSAAMQPSVDSAVYGFLSNPRGPIVQPPPKVMNPSGSPPQGVAPPSPQSNPTPQSTSLPQATPAVFNPQDDKGAAIDRAQGDVAALTRELSRTNLLPEQRQIISQELDKTRAKLANLKGEAPPYKTLAPSGQGQQQGFSTVPAPPQSGPQAPGQSQQGFQPQQGMTVFDVASYLKQQGITNPRVAMAVMEKLQPYMNSEAKQELAMVKAQNQFLLGVGGLAARNRTQDERERHDEATESARRDGLKTSEKLADLRVSQAEAQTKAVQDGALDAAAWDYAIRGTQPPKRGGMYEKVMGRVAEIAKANGMTPQQFVSASADVKSKLAAKRNFETRAQNLQRAENQLESELPVLEQAMSQLDPSKYPDLANIELSVLRRAGDPRVTTMDQAAAVVFNEFNGIVTGNPGTLNVQDVQTAQREYHEARSPQQLQAAVNGMRRIIGNAQGAIKKTRTEIMQQINDEFHADPAASSGGIPQGWSVKVK